MASILYEGDGEHKRQDLKVFATIFGERTFEGRCIEGPRGDDASRVILAARFNAVKADTHVGSDTFGCGFTSPSSIEQFAVASRGASARVARA